MKTFVLCSLLAASAWAARVETISTDLNRQTVPVSITTTAESDSDVILQVRSDGADFDATGWTGLLFFGRDNLGTTITNTTAGYGQVAWTIPAALMPDTGKYSVQILGAKGTVLEEWARGFLNVRTNTAVNATPTVWNGGTVSALAMEARNRADVALSNALAAASAASVADDKAVEAQSTANSANSLGESNRLAIAAIPPPSTDAWRIVTPNGNEWRDATGAVWRVTCLPATTNVTLSEGFGYWNANVDFTAPPLSQYTLPFIDGEWRGYIVNAAIGEYSVCQSYDGMEWRNSDYEGNIVDPITLTGWAGPESHWGYATVNIQQSSTVTSHVDTVALLSDLSSFTVDTEIHADSFTNLIWRTVWSNGWCWVVAVTNVH